MGAGTWESHHAITMLLFRYAEYVDAAAFDAEYVDAADFGGIAAPPIRPTAIKVAYIGSGPSHARLMAICGVARTRG
ncbi:MAG: hypothetical protein ACT4OX_08165 [Actinomycetota bacterium]